MCIMENKTFQFYGGRSPPLTPWPTALEICVPTAQGTPSPTGVNPCKTPPTAQGAAPPTYKNKNRNIYTNRNIYIQTEIYIYKQKYIYKSRKWV